MEVWKRISIIVIVVCIFLLVAVRAGALGFSCHSNLAPKPRLDRVAHYVVEGRWGHKKNGHRVLEGGLHSRAFLDRWLQEDPELALALNDENSFLELSSGVVQVKFPKWAVSEASWTQTKGYKTFFPASWTSADIEEAVEYIIAVGHSRKVGNDKYESVGVYRSVRIKVVYTDDFLITAFPVVERKTAGF
ncbi:MAG: EndoU domain-containing protein [Pseudobdellovibrionaceae bacterium]|nr:EndoU domain-containing protein [Bdellovibrionales bacterium]USN47736.1 MAG: EndoU domain-containing protein [Pseudobdellovibrionaceae bacterium]